MASTQRKIVGDGFELHVSVVAGILRAQVEGPHDTLAISMAYWTKIVEERTRSGLQRVLVIENLEETGSLDDLMPLLDHLIKLDLVGCKVAFVDSGSSQRSAQEHMTIVAREHGILAGVFGDENEAMIWLRHGEE